MAAFYGPTLAARLDPDDRTRRRAPHPANTLNELPGEEWLYFTKSLLTTAYPSELGHAARKAHGANKPPRLMARLIEFFSRTGELVLDPFAGVGGTLLGAAIARGPRRAIGIELDPRWAAIYEARRARPVGRARRRSARSWPTSGTADPGGPRPFDPSGCELRVGDALAVLPTLADGSIDLVATDPPYNLQLPMTMAGGPLAETHANRRTDYAMVTDRPPTSPTRPTTRPSSTGWRRVFGELRRVLRDRAATPSSSCATPTRTGATCSPARTSRRARRAVGLVPKGDLIWYQAGTRLRPYGYPHAFVPNIVHQHILVLRNGAAAVSLAAAARLEVGARGRRCRRPPRPSSSVSAAIGIVAVGPVGRGAVVVDDLAERHLVEPALLAVGAEDEPVGAVLLEQLDLVALVEDSRSRAPRSSSGESSRRTTR